MRPPFPPLPAEDLETYAQRLRVVADAAPVMLAYVDARERYLFANTAYATWFDLPREAMLGRTVREVVGEAAYELLRTPMHVALAGQRVHFERPVPYRGGTRTINATYVPHVLPDGTVAGYVSTILDVTERLRAEKERERTSRFREHFLGVVSHDLRNPLSAILAGANALLHAGTLDERQGRMVARIARSAAGMERMIGDLLDFTRVRLGDGFPLEPVPTHLDALCQEVLEELGVAWPARELRSGLTPLPAGRWDRHRLTQAVSNLLGNALQHSPEGTPVTVTTRAEGSFAVLEVHNGGDPIPAELQPHLFEPFRRGAHSPGRRGLGLGLYIAHEIVRAHGGTLEVQSSAEEGTTFTMRLPPQPPAR
ncbi:HAMP domain-containing histidine kinase [Pyxidicoccus fallax]|uniref:histidine kinase n=1 Tax=Pyxidicoccus fallax TaxID=394095 RepID=A0A848LJX2_9BACT|nr:HAMP domain-containing sensor histidine kinase [Pyxidicoccus fallax]NMO17998.1 HAMP domain-containing histidine kinase [Pyxidicoccus fallax]NPC79515.1 HAMP domain-containing histidine kinase [Pyxidicoccus fallax]